MSLKEAYSFVKARRKNARPNIGFIVQLAEYERQLSESRDTNAMGTESKSSTLVDEGQVYAPSIPPELLESRDEKKIYDFLNAPPQLPTKGKK